MLCRTSSALLAFFSALILSADAFQLSGSLLLRPAAAGRVQRPPAMSPFRTSLSPSQARLAPLSTPLGLRMSSSSSGRADFDVAVVGGGPAGLALSAELGDKGLSVVCFDPSLQARFVPNYGVWVDEIAPLGLEGVLNTVWPKATVMMGGAVKDHKNVLDRPYGRVDRDKIKAHFMKRCNAAGVEFKETGVDVLEHEASLTTLKASDGEAVSARLVVDCTGHAKRFVEFQDGAEPGYQAAYGIEADVEAGTYPHPLDEMLLMDYRDAHMSSSADQQESEAVPTFIYCMPTSSTRVFFEETSLIANPAVPFDDLKRRMYQRLELWGTKIKEVHEEEFCLIPMGGAMPKVPQRVVGFGGSAGLVHPATGYMISRTFQLASSTADSIHSALKAHPVDSTAAAHAVWQQLWNPQSQRQRDFAAFGGEYLESIGLTELREFFGAFFVLPFEQWGGFLSHRLVHPYQRLVFGLGVWANTSNRVRLSLSLKGFLSGPQGWYTLARSVLPVADYDEKQFPTANNQPNFFRAGPEVKSVERTPTGAGTK
mmetsp:Transcript_2122/g.4866  ORF Transcript_2122/g.4866 Transcript_2122/m.4866 type:complete len:540 (-) Transcript_2122:95-1714(-)